eukprot:COSAG02_NODE_4445_length_5346_cov_5.916333_6_plen_191_part_00
MCRHSQVCKMGCQSSATTSRTCHMILTQLVPVTVMPRHHLCSTTHQPHPSGPEGTGPPGSPQYQGWQRDCEQLCGEAEADLLDVVAGVTEACVDDVTDMEPCDTSTFAAGIVVRSAAEANCGAGCAYTAYAAPMVTDTRTQTSTQTSTTNLNDRFANSSRSSPSRISSAGVATPALAMLAIVALTRWRVV